MSIVRLKNFAVVRVTHQPSRDRGYYSDVHAERRQYNGLLGNVIAEHDSHGLCYEVKFPDGRVVTYDHEELEIGPS